MGAKFLVLVVDLPTSSASMLFLFKNRLVYGALQLLMERVLSSSFEFHVRILNIHAVSSNRHDRWQLSFYDAFCLPLLKKFILLSHLMIRPLSKLGCC